MTQLNQVYKCAICGNIVEMLHTGAGELVCCEQPMNLLVAKKNNEGQEKHVPVIIKNKNTITIKIGAEPHPMIDEHYIEWIEAIANKQVYRKFLKPNDLPQAEFNIDSNNVVGRCYCNVHDLWSS